MPIISPFRGLRYNPKKVKSLSSVVTPPYDVISLEAQAGYYKKHPLNFIRVVYGKASPSDRAGSDRYSRAKRTLQEWVRDEVMIYDDEPSVYPYLQEYVLEGKRCKRWGVVALVRLDSPRIYPHEQIRQGPMEDRLRLLSSAEASLSAVFGLIPDEAGGYLKMIESGCRGKRPVAVAVLEKAKHSVWRISDPAWIRALKAALKSKELVIADGHHRFEAAQAYRNMRKEQDPDYSPRSPYNFAMFYLAAAGAEEPGLLPTHRLVKHFPRERAHALLDAAATQVSVRPTRNLQELSGCLRELQGKGRLGLGFYSGNGGYLLQPPTGSSYRIDVEWLHQEILPQWVGPDVEVDYTQDLGEAVRQLKARQAQAIFVTQPPSLAEVLERARTATRMPGKTTYFHPKPLAGLVEYTFKTLKGSDPFRGKRV